MSDNQKEHIVGKALDTFRVQIPAWGFANTPTRHGRFSQPAAATSLEEKLSDAAQVHRFTGCCPEVSLHALWDFAEGIKKPSELFKLAQKNGLNIGTINPNVFENQIYQFGSLGNPDAKIRHTAISHIQDCIQLAKHIDCKNLELWFADGSNYPGTANIRQRREWFKDGLQKIHSHLSSQQRLLIEYKPFEPWFYHSDIADWGMALILARSAGAQAKVLVDLGHHYQYQNVEQIVAWLLAEDLLGGFHFNDRHFADDDLSLGSIDPFQVFRIFHEIIYYEWENEQRSNLTFAIAQSHNLKVKIEAMIQTVNTAQELYAKAALVDHLVLAQLQAQCQLIEAEECLKDAFYTDVRPLVIEWRRSKGLVAEPLTAFRQSGYLEQITEVRKAKT